MNPALAHFDTLVAQLRREIDTALKGHDLPRVTAILDGLDNIAAKGMKEKPPPG